MARLAMSKCRLCLKLGDFYSIFAEDDSVQLARMAMACSDVQIHKGDGLPDKVCGECVEKLSAAYIFKQQCERSDSELRKSYNSSIDHKNDNLSEKLPTNTRKRRKHHDIEETGNTNNGLLEERYSVYVPNTLSLERKKANALVHIKKRRLSESLNSRSSNMKNKAVCKYCNKVFDKQKSLFGHLKIHSLEIKEEQEGSSNAKSYYDNNIPQTEDITNAANLRDGGKFDCETCGKQYHNRVLYNEHIEQCKGVEFDKKFAMKCISQLLCPVCKTKYKKKIYLRKHLGRSSCGVKLKNIVENNESLILPDKVDYRSKNVQCSNCNGKFRSYSAMLKHFLKCTQDKGINKICCKTCNINFNTKNYFYKHVKRVHILDNVSMVKNIKQEKNFDPESDALFTNKLPNTNSLQCHKCSKAFENQTQLVMHLAAHMANIDEGSKLTSKSSFKILKCAKCHKKFRYKASLRNHMKKYHKNISADSPALGASLKSNECDLCGKSFKYAKSLIWHRNTKHPTIDDSLIALQKRGIEYSKCPAKCLHCDVVLDNEHETKMHNRIHIEKNVKVKNEYSCPDCGLKFTNTKYFRLHIKEHNDSNFDNDENVFDASISNYCEVTSSAVRDSDEEVDIKPINVTTERKPIIEPDGVTCSICNKKLDSMKGYHLHMRTHTKVEAKPVFDMSCFICQQRFLNKEDHQKHMRIHYNDDNLDPALLVCSICYRPSKNLRSYIAHMSWHTVDGRFKCFICNEKFSYFKFYRNHMVSKHQINVDNSSDPTKFKCHVCNKYYDNDLCLQYHILSHQQKDISKEEMYECLQCKEQFTTKYQHIIHMQTIHRIRQNWESYVDFPKSKPKYSKKLKKITKNKIKMLCPVCDIPFISRIRLDKHLKTMHPVKKMVKKNDPDAEIPMKHICVLCGKEFSNDARLQSHLAQHKRKPNLYKCTLCFRKTHSLKLHLIHLKGHLMKHHKEKPVKCESCEKQFVRRRELRIHLKQTHNITENYVKVVDADEDWKPGELQEHQCHVCGKILRSQGSYHKHLMWHNTRRCNYCFTYFDKKTFLLAHIMYSCDKKKLIGNSDQFDKRLKCHICLKQFSIVVKLHCHMKVQHNADPVDKGVVTKSSVCDFCFSVFSSEERMISHRKCHFYSGSMKCKVCLKPFRVLSYFKNHKVRHYRQSFADKPLKCDHCDEQFITLYTYVKHLRTAHKLPMVWLATESMPLEKCSICHKEFTHLERHMMYHDKYKCKKCNQYFFSEILYNNHFCEVASENEAEETDNKVDENLNSNTIEVAEPVEPPPYQECDFCFKPISTFYTKTKHDSNHSKVVYFCCRLCDRRFFMKSAFNVHSTSHRLQHFKKNPLKCRHCGELFTRYQHYTEHIRQVHDDPETMEFHLKPSQPKECAICKKTFVNLHRHYKYHLSLRCKDCSKYILSQKLYNNHNCNDPNEDQSLLVDFEDDISPLMDPDDNEWESERMVESIPRNEDFVLPDSFNDSDMRNNSFLHSFNDFASDEPNSSITGSIPEDYLTNMNAYGQLSFDSFAPIISSTVSLSSSTVAKDKEDDVEIVNIQVKSEPIDHYYREYGQYDYQSPLMDIMDPSG